MTKNKNRSLLQFEFPKTQTLDAPTSQAYLRYFLNWTHLNNPHGQPRLLGQLLSDVSRGLRRLIEGRLQDLQLFCLDCRSGTSSF